MKAQTDNKNRTSKSRAQYVCPGCGIGFCVDRIGGAYGLYPQDFDDIFYVVVCKRCGIHLHSDEVE